MRLPTEIEGCHSLIFRDNESGRLGVDILNNESGRLRGVLGDRRTNLFQGVIDLVIVLQHRAAPSGGPISCLLFHFLLKVGDEHPANHIGVELKADLLCRQQAVYHRVSQHIKRQPVLSFNVGMMHL